MRPYTRSLHTNDYDFLPDGPDLLRFEWDMVSRGIPRRDWHQHRIWEYASILQQLRELGVPQDAEIIDIGAGASFFDPYLALRYPKLCELDCGKYDGPGAIEWLLNAQRSHYGVALPLYQLSVEDMSAKSEIGWDGAQDKFDVTMCISVIEHVDNHDVGFQEMVRITKPGGYIFITSDYFRDKKHWEESISRDLQITAYTKELVLKLPEKFGVEFVGATDLDYCGDFVHNYSFVNVCLRKPV